MWEGLISILAAGATLLTWYLTKRKYSPELEAVKRWQSKYNILFAKYSQVVKERNALRTRVGELEKMVYENYTMSDLIDAINSLPKIGGDGDAGNN